MKTYTARLPFDGILSVSVDSPTVLTDEEVIQRAAELPGQLHVINTFSSADATEVDNPNVDRCMIEEWQIHQGPVDRGNVCYFMLTRPEVELVDDDDDD